jgi:hypothetical protein
MAGADPGMTISGLSDTGVSPGRRFQPLILGLAVAIWALTHSTGHDSRDPSGLTLARQPGHSSALPVTSPAPSSTAVSSSSRLNPDLWRAIRCRRAVIGRSFVRIGV